MKKLDLASWKRASHFNFYKQFASPHFSLTAHCNITALYRFCKEHTYQLYPCYLYASQRAVHQIEEFRYRIEANEPVVFDTVHAAPTVPMPDETFRFSLIKMKDHFQPFFKEYQSATEKARQADALNPDYPFQDVIYYTVIPWVSFTSVTNPSTTAQDGVPRIAFGKIFEQNSAYFIPIGVEVHHALMDGLHVGKYFERMEALFSAPEKLIEG